ncbi:MAG: LysM peptidoglycan-binding domain-containing protein, partial [Bacillus sp. (in: firmicutes)]
PSDPTPQPTTISYSVVSGDSLWAISKKYGTTVDAIRSANNLTNDRLFIGQTLMIPSGNTAPDPAPTPAPNPAPAPVETISYTVKAGDTLSAIAKLHNTTVTAIKSSNGLTTDIIRVGQVLSIPTGSTAPAPAPSPVPGPAPVVQTISYTVKAGDTLSAIAKLHNTTVTAIKSSNGLTSDIIRVGQVLSIPSNSTPTPTPTSETGTATVIQKQLQSLGYYAVPTMTGNYDSSTIQAIKTFQSDYGLPLTGTGDSATVTALEHAVVKKGLIQDSQNFVGVPYLWGGTTPSGFDCSGFVYYMFNKHGVQMTRSTSSNLYNQGTAITKSKLQPGDLVFYAVNSPGVISHVGFYVGDNKFISATSSKGIQVVSLDNSYWSQYYVGAKRVY